MAKYIRVGATFNGDGTTPALATIDNGPGAWNDRTYFEGTSPASPRVLVGGETVYIRSKDEAGIDISVTISSDKTLGSASATAANWITWIIDGGTVWPGIDGTVTYNCPAGWGIYLRNYNHYIAEKQDKLVIRETNTSGDDKIIVQFETYCQMDNVFIDCTLNTHYINSKMISRNSSECTFRNVHIKWNQYYRSLWTFLEMSKNVLINPLIELTTPSTTPIFSMGNYGAKLQIFGGRVFGAGANDVACLFGANNTGGTSTAVGLSVPRAVNIMTSPPSTQGFKIEMTGLDNGLGAVVVENWGRADTRSDGYYPTLDAFLPTSAGTPWSWKIYPSNASPINQFNLPVAKFYTAADAIVPVTARFLIADTITVANAKTLWIEVSYIDASTGIPVSVSSRDLSAAALSSDTSGWTTSTYGPTNLLKRKVSVTTPTSIKQDTPITVTVCGTFKSTTALDIIFFDPDVSLS